MVIAHVRARSMKRRISMFVHAWFMLLFDVHMCERSLPKNQIYGRAMW